MNGTGIRTYAVTIKRTGKEDPTFAQTNDAVDQIKKIFRQDAGISIGHTAFERDSRKRLHAHFTIRYRPFQYTRFQLKGYHVNYSPLKTSEDLKKWINYLKKSAYSVPLLQQEDIRNYYASHNGFLDV